MINLKTIQMNNRLNGYMIQTDKFKTDLIGVYIKRQLNKEEAGLNTLLSRVLVRGTQTLRTTKALNTYLENNYGMILVSDMVKYGDYHILQMKLQFPDPKHLLEKDLLVRAMDFMKSLLFEPLIEDDRFKDSYFEQEKYHLIDEIKSRVNDKMSYSIDRCIECMYEGEGYAEYVYGDEMAIEAITNEQLYNHYLKVMSTSTVDITVMGDIDFHEVGSMLKEFTFDESLQTTDVFETHELKAVREIHESFDVKQGKLVLGYHTPFVGNHPLFEASVLAYYILGGSPSSKLFKLLREDHGLCYYVFTKSDKFKGNMFIGVGIESKTYDQVLTMIQTCIQNIELDEAVVEQAKKAVITSIRSILDYPNSFLNFFYTEMLMNDGHFDLEEMMSKYETITVKDIMKVYKGLTLDTIYFINGGGE